MKNFNLLLKNWGFWCVIYCVLCTFIIIVITVIWSKQECPKTDIAPLEKQIIESQLKIKEYESKITLDSLIIWNSSRSDRDSLRAIRFKNYVR